MSTTAVTPANARDFLQYVELTTVRTYALAGRRREAPEPADEVVPEVGVRLSDDTLETRMRLVVETAQAELEADISVVYSLTRPVNLWSHVVTEFVERVAVMAVYPFVREAVYATASRMGVDAPVLGLIRQGELHVDTDGPELAPSRVPASLASLAEEFALSTPDARQFLEAVGLEIPTGRRKLGPDVVGAARRALILRERGATDAPE